MKLSKYLKPYWLLAILSPLLMIGEVVVDLFQPKLMGKIVDEGVLGENMDVVVQTGLLMLGLVLIGGFFGTLCAYTASKAAQGFAHDLRCDAFNKVMSLSIEQTDQFTVGSLVTRLTNDISMVQQLVQMLLRMFVRAPIFLIGGSIMMLTLNVKFSLVALAGLPILLVLVVLFLRKVTPLFGQVQKKLDRVNSVVQENVGGARVIKAYVREDYEKDRFEQANRDFYQVNYKVMSIMCFLSPLLMIVMNLAVVVIIYIGGLEAQAQNIKPGEIMAAVTYLAQIFHSVMMVNMMFQSLSRSAASAKRINEVLDSDPVIVSGTETTGTETDCCISFRHVDFFYPGAAGRPVLNDINLEVRRGETLAVIGATGSGKSSLVKLIPRFYDVTGGEVCIDGVPVQEYDLDALRHKISYVMQKSELFSDTIANNIRWGKEDATEAEIRDAAETAQADAFVRGFQDDYNTFIAEKGASLSGGQKQRISIARALVRKPEILILDDSTSALDLATESKLRGALRQKMKGTTVVMIAQRIASVREADRIAVMDGGTIVACDTHENLLKTCAAYREIYDSQMKSGAYAEGGADL